MEKIRVHLNPALAIFNGQKYIVAGNAFVKVPMETTLDRVWDYVELIKREDIENIKHKAVESINPSEDKLFKPTRIKICI